MSISFVGVAVEIMSLSVSCFGHASMDVIDVVANDPSI